MQEKSGIMINQSFYEFFIYFFIVADLDSGDSEYVPDSVSESSESESGEVKIY